MAHYAYIDNQNIVTQVIVGRDEKDLDDGIADWETYYGEKIGMLCVRTSYNTLAGVHYNPSTGKKSKDQSKALRKNYAGIGYSYDAERDAFIPPQPGPDWTLDEATCTWIDPNPPEIAAPSEA
tara:strand:+ start:690 stop:1058 length:369 start_codon:yes stop_codon:yes gene_type:complete